MVHNRLDKVESTLASQGAVLASLGAATRNLEVQAGQLLADVKSRYIKSSPSDMESLYLDGTYKVVVEISMEDASEDPT